MTVVAALYSGISGITANGSALAVSGDNIANISTPGFKSSSPVFESALSQTIGSSEIGLGGRLAGTAANFSQGAFANSTRGTDLAIQGRGFFILKSASGDSFYTRAGIFERSGTGDLLSSAGGYVLQGYPIDSTTLRPTRNLTNINLSNIRTDPVPTTKVSSSLNLDSSSDIRSDSFDGSSHAAAATHSDFSSSTTVYDSLGVSHTVITYFRHVDNNKWSYHALTLGSELATSTAYTGAGAATATVCLDEGTITFSNAGAFASSALTVSAGALAQYSGAGHMSIAGMTLYASTNPIQWAGGAAAATSFQFDFGQGNLSTARATQFGSASSINSISQDGSAQGDLSTITFDVDGTITGSFSNGTTRSLYKVPLATFQNEEGLSRKGNNVYQETTNSGVANPGDPQTSGRGELRPFSIEQSNVDLATEFVKIITYQRAFQASARTITTAGELLQDLVNLGK